MSFEEPLVGGVANQGSVVRAGDTVRRPAGPHTPAVHAYLRHLGSFPGSPDVVGIDERGREILTYVSGDVPDHHDQQPWVRTDIALLSVVALARALHEAARGFVPPADAAWAWPPPAAYRGDVVGHNDVCRENVVFRSGRAVALIDFDFAGPTTWEWELAGVVRHWVLPLPDAERRWHLVRVPGLKDALLDRLEWGIAMVRARAEAGEPGFVAMWRAGAYERNRALRAWVAERVDD